MAKTMHEIHYTKKNWSRKNVVTDEKPFCKLINNVVYGKKLRKRVEVRLVNSEKEYLKWASKPGFVTQKIFENGLVAIHKILTLNIPEYVGMCISELSEVPMHEFRYDYIKSNYRKKLRLLFADTDGLVNKSETENRFDDFSKNKELFNFNNYSVNPKYNDDSNALVVLYKTQYFTKSRTIVVIQKFDDTKILVEADYKLQMINYVRYKRSWQIFSGTVFTGSSSSLKVDGRW